MAGKDFNQEEPPPVRTLYDRRKHKSVLVDEGKTINRILVQPSTKPGRMKLTDENPILIFPASADPATTPEPPRKFIPATPTLPERSFGRKWQTATSHHVSSSDDEDDLRIPVTEAAVAEPSSTSSCKHKKAFLARNGLIKISFLLSSVRTTGGE